MLYYILASVEARHGRFEPAAAKLRLFLQSNPDAETAVAVKAILAEWAEDDQAKKAP